MQGKEIDKFLNKYCDKVATDESGWEILYRAKSTQEYWVKTYPNSEQHGGGKPVVVNISKEAAEAKFGV
ncbi:Imm27 family immunity protein [uncultured Pseudoteredinibacter sp.]|uniref:Imm27 family immunity protein n=1 Tax=uncultured Pseudoteredinibacter sp. TaxID=1641701 RepID=UPI00262B0DC3|nr:Imm27 family immunity protein [uncultured Pseudoteredinibacter sp.]